MGGLPVDGGGKEDERGEKQTHTSYMQIRCHTEDAETKQV